MQLCSIAYFSVIKIRMGAISSAVSSAADCTHSNFDEWKWATEQRSIHIEITSYKIRSLVEQYAIELSFFSLFFCKEEMKLTSSVSIMSSFAPTCSPITSCSLDRYYRVLLKENLAYRTCMSIPSCVFTFFQKLRG